MSKESIFDRIGGKTAVDAAVDIFYDKVMADNRINHLFKDTDMPKQIAKQRMFLTYAFGGSPNYSGLSMRKAHEKLVNEKGLNGDHFTAVAENLQSTLEELNVPSNLASEVMTLVASTKADVLNQ